MPRIHTRDVVARIAAGLVMLIMLSTCGPSAPKTEITQGEVSATVLARLRPQITSVVASRTGAHIAWSLDRERDDIIRGYLIYISQSEGLSRLPSGDRVLDGALYQFSTYAGDTDGDIRKETITIEQLTMGTEYYVHIRTAFPNGQTSSSLEEVRFIPRPRGIFVLNPRLSGDQEGFSFAMDTVVEWTAMTNDIYLYVVRDTVFLASPSRQNSDLRASLFLDLGSSQSLDEYPRMPSGTGEGKIVLKENRSVGVRLDDGRLAKMRVVDIQKNSDPVRVTFEYLYQPLAGEDSF